MSRLKWRKCTVEDVDFIADEICREAANGHYVKSITTGPGKISFIEQIRDHIIKGNCYDKQFGLMNFHGYIAEMDGVKAGYSIFRETKGVAEIWFFGLAENFQGQNLSHELLNKTIEKLNGNKTTILARCLEDSKAMMRILQKKGFVILGEEKGTTILCNKKLPL